jgi:epoxyqueuosine reductase QueG
MTIDILDKQKATNTHKIQQSFFNYLQKVKYKGIFGVASFKNVFNSLLPVQKKRLQDLLGKSYEDFMKTGSIISLGIIYPPEIIEYINVQKQGLIDKEKWNLYGDEYKHLNDMLKEIGYKLAHEFNGISIPPTTGAPVDLINNVKDYYPFTISHRVVAEHAGLGWRGKSELIITENYGPAVRFTSILINLPLLQGNKIENKCGECMACLEACPILKNKNNLADYRETCRKYLISLDLKYDVCGKCIKACYNKFFYNIRG